MKKIRIAFSIILVFLLAACSGGINLFSDKDDVALGLQLKEEIIKNPKEYPIYKGDPSVKAYIEKNIFNKILESPLIEKKGVYNYQLEIVQNDSILNAFAAPGGNVYVYTGLLKYLDSEAALAGVLAHEIAHAERRHATTRITKAYGFAALSNLILGNNPSEVASIISNVLQGGLLFANSRSDEDQSDEYSFKYLQGSKYYPGSVKFFFEKLRDDKKISSDGKGLSKTINMLLSTHPDPLDRIRTTDERLKEAKIPLKTYKSNDKDVFRAEYEKNIKKKLR